MNKILGLTLIGIGFALGMFIGKNRRLVRTTGQQIHALKEDAKNLIGSAGEWIDKGKAELVRGKDTLQSAAGAAVSAYEKITA